MYTKIYLLFLDMSHAAVLGYLVNLIWNSRAPTFLIMKQVIQRCAYFSSMKKMQDTTYEKSVCK
jgi:hypothetical protein